MFIIYQACLLGTLAYLLVRVLQGPSASTVAAQQRYIAPLADGRNRSFYFDERTVAFLRENIHPPFPRGALRLVVL